MSARLYLTIALAACAHRSPPPMPSATAPVVTPMEPTSGSASTAADREVTGCDALQPARVRIAGTWTNVGLEVCHPGGDSYVARIVTERAGAAPVRQDIDRWRDTPGKTTRYTLSTVLLTPHGTDVLIIGHMVQTGDDATSEVLAYSFDSQWNARPLIRGFSVEKVELGEASSSISITMQLDRDSARTRTIDVSHNGKELVVVPRA